MTFSLKHGPGLVEAGDAALPNVALTRGLQLGRNGLEPRTGTLGATMDANRIAVNDALQLEETTGAGTRLWTGQVYEVKQSVDRQLNALRYSVGARGIIRRLLTAGNGRTTDLHRAISVDQAIIAVCDAIGLDAAERDIGPSARMLANWWLDPADDAWRMIVNLVRTAGPRARLYEDEMGRLVFRDAALPATPDHTVRGRLSSAATNAIVSRLEQEQAGIDRIINRISLEGVDYANSPDPARVWEGDRSFSVNANSSRTLMFDIDEPVIAVPQQVLGVNYVRLSGGGNAPTIRGVAISPYQLAMTANNSGNPSFQQLRFDSIDARRFADYPRERVTAESAASIAIYGERAAGYQVYPGLDVAAAQLLADELVDQRAYPRRSWSVVLDAERNAATRDVCLEAEIGQRLRVDLDAQLSDDAEVVLLKHQISGPANLLQTTIQCLAAELTVPSDNFLYIDGLDNPLYIDSLDNPLEVR